MSMLKPRNLCLKLTEWKVDIFWTKVKRNGFACLSYNLIIIQFSAAILHHSNIQSVCHFFKNPEWCSNIRNFPLDVRVKLFAERNKRGSGLAEVFLPFLLIDNAIHPSSLFSPVWSKVSSDHPPLMGR